MTEQEFLTEIDRMLRTEWDPAVCMTPAVQQYAKPWMAAGWVDLSREQKLYLLGHRIGLAMRLQGLLGMLIDEALEIRAQMGYEECVTRMEEAARTPSPDTTPR